MPQQLIFGFEPNLTHISQKQITEFKPNFTDRPVIARTTLCLDF